MSRILTFFLLINQREQALCLYDISNVNGMFFTIEEKKIRKWH
jgi:hypothetical protein